MNEDKDSAPGSALVADDDPQLRDICSRVLRGLGLRVEQAATGEEAWELLCAGNFDLLVTDIRMPGGMDGEALVAAVKSRSPSTDVIVMTGYPELSTAVATLKSGAADFLVKPVSPDLLEAVAARCLARRRLSEELGREKLMRAEIEAAYAELQKVERLRDAILSRVHHELRTPITIALGSAELLVQEKLPGQAGTLAEQSLRGVTELRDRVEEILLFSELKAAEGPGPRSEADLAALLAGAAALVRPAWEEKGVSVSLPPATGGPALRLNPELVSTALKNLLLNAVKFTPRGGKVEVALEADGKSAAVSFKDSGPGIPQDKLPGLTDPFYQAAEVMTRTAGGLGLGLAIVRRIAEAHGGSISVKTATGKGSTFTLRLPL